MADDKDYAEYKKWRGKRYRPGGGAGFAYFLGFIGAAVYYIQNAATFGGGILGLLKALVWPAFLIYQALHFMHA